MKPAVEIKAVEAKAVEVEKVETKEEKVSVVKSSPKRSVSVGHVTDVASLSIEDSPSKPGMRKSVSVGETSRKFFRDFLQRQGPTQLGLKKLPEVKERTWQK